jgi:putative multiple sugar transport system permease protein
MGLVEEPFVFFVGRNLLVAAGFLLFSYLMASYKGLPNVLIVMFALIVLYAFATSSMTIGRRIYALGGNEKAARLSGIKTHRLTFYTFANMGLLAGLAGLIFAARLNTATPKAGPRLRARRDRRLLHRRRLGLGWRGQGGGRGDRRLRDGRHEQRHVDPRHRHRLQQMIKGLVLLAAVFLDVYYKNKA